MSWRFLTNRARAIKKWPLSNIFPWTRRLNSTNGAVSTEHIIRSPFPDVKLPRCTVPDLIWGRVERWPEKTAIECGVTGKSYTYAQLKLSSQRFALSMLKYDLKKNDVITVILPNMAEFPIVLFGIFEAGLTASCINPLYTEEEILRQMIDNGSTFVVTIPSKIHTVQSIAYKLKKPIKMVCVDDESQSDDLPALCTTFSNSIRDVSVSDLNRLRHRVNIFDTALIPYSSGTTGLPKGVCLTHDSMSSNVAQICSKDVQDIPESTSNFQATVPCFVPFFFIYGFAVLMFRSLYQGAKIISFPKFQPDALLNVFSSNKEIIFHAVPPMIFFLNTYPAIEAKHLDNLRLTISSGAPCSPKDIEKLLDKKPHRFAQIYGLTESSPVLTHSLEDSRDYSTVGVPVNNTLAKVIDPVTGKSLPLGEMGELCFKGPQLMKGYLNKPVETSKTIDPEGWIHTGDVGYFDENSNCFIVDRAKEIIKVKGFQVAPAELEAVLRQHPKIRDAGVTSKTCPKAGERPVAFIVILEGSRVTLDEVKKFVASKVAPYKVIDDVFVIDEIPKLPSGKIKRNQLKILVKSE